MIPKIMRDKTKVEKCAAEVAEFTKCCSENGLLMAFKCRKENAAMKECQTKWYQDENFKSECTEIYLQERKEYRQTGIPKKYRTNESDMSGTNNNSSVR